MSERKLYTDRQLTGKQWFWFLAFMGLLTRLSMLRLSTAETTDGIFCLTYFTTGWTQTHHFGILPGYPLLLWLGQSIGLPGGLLGRSLSALAGTLFFLIPLWKFSRRWVTVEMAGIICLMALFSPLLWQWSLKVTADTLFLLAFWWGLERLAAVDLEKREWVWVQGCFAGAAAACVRPEGFILMPWVFLLGIQSSPSELWKRAGIFLLLWAAPVLFIKDRFTDILYAYQEGTGLTAGASPVQFPLLNFIDHFYAYLSQPLYVFTPLVFWFAILGLAKMVRRKDPVGGAFKTILLPVFLLVLLSRLVPTIYQDRHMLPFLPLLLVACGFQLENFFESLDKQKGHLRMMIWKNGLIAVCMVWLFVFSAIVLIAQSDSFGDIKRSAEFLKTLPANAYIYSDEIPKTRYWSGRELKPLILPFKPRAGEYLILHSFYTARIGYVDQNLKERHNAVLLHSEESMVVPLLTDTMEDAGLQNRIASTAFRFRPQFFKSLVYKIGK